VLFGSRGLHCLDLDGSPKRSRELGKMTFTPQWGERTPRAAPVSWTTPFVATHNGKPQVVVSGSTHVRGYDFASGAKLWECGGMGVNTIPTPVMLDGTVYCMVSCQVKALKAIWLGFTADITGKPEAIAWSHSAGTPYVASPLLYGKRLYFFSQLAPRLSICDAKSGVKHADTQPLAERPGAATGFAGNVHASPLGAAGRVYVASLGGSVMVLKDANELSALASAKFDDSFAASPVAVGADLLLRGRGRLCCFAANSTPTPG